VGWAIGISDLAVDEVLDVRVAEAWYTILQKNIATDREIKLVTDVVGCNMKALDDIVYVRTGYHDVTALRENK